MNAPIDLDRVAISRNVSAIRAKWTNEERQLRANAAKRYSKQLLRLVSGPVECDEIWAVGAPTDLDLDRLAMTG